jgi:hypothetical protein
VNWFTYVNNDPVNWVDLWGLEAYVYVWEENGKTYVNILIPITYEGEGATPDVIAKFNDAIEEGWSGEFGKYTVQTIVTQDTTTGLMNTIKVPVGNETARTFVGGPTGTWPSERPGWTAKHENGHLLGLHDIKETDPNYAGNIMGPRGGVVKESTIDQVLGNVGSDGTIRAASTRRESEPGSVQNPDKKNH